ncbi:MAG: hypothetical protein SPI30_01120 [Prevotella sp.]|nr:hypothetical protein [Prevotella sp.]
MMRRLEVERRKKAIAKVAWNNIGDGKIKCKRKLPFYYEMSGSLISNQKSVL